MIRTLVIQARNSRILHSYWQSHCCIRLDIAQSPVHAQISACVTCKPLSSVVISNHLLKHRGFRQASVFYYLVMDRDGICCSLVDAFGFEHGLGKYISRHQDVAELSAISSLLPYVLHDNQGKVI